MSEGLLLSLTEAAERLGVSVSTVKRSVRDGVLRSVRLTKGGARRIAVAEIERVVGNPRSQRSHLQAWHAGRTVDREEANR